MNKCLIICWYGRLPQYFKIFEKTCAYNIDYDFFIFTNQEYQSEYKNIKVYHKTIDELKILINEKLEINAKIEKAYKFCDFKPTYGKIFEDYIKKYEYWGYCDVDMFLGKLSDFVKDELIKKYEKINICGHFTLYRNNEKCKKLYKENGSIFSYKEVYENSENYAFDEYSGMKKIASFNNIKTLEINDFADIDKKYSRYKCVNHRNYNQQFFSWEDGRIFRYYKESEVIYRDEFMYLHFQKKHPNFEKNILENNEKMIIGRDKIYMSDNIDFKKSFSINEYKGKFYENMELIKYILMKCISFVKCSKKEKIIWIKQKIG